MMRFVLLAAAMVATSSARMAYELSDGSEAVLSAPLQTTFSCEGLPYGYYADMDNNCEVFHVCLPISDHIGALVETAHFSFFCGNETLFDQESLSCNHKEEAFPCSEARTLYEISNADFGVIPDDDGQRAIHFVDEIELRDEAA